MIIKALLYLMKKFVAVLGIKLFEKILCEEDFSKAAKDNLRRCAFTL